MTPAAALYVHLPFCPYLCPYCDFAKWAWNGGAAERYLRALHAEIERAPGVAATTVYFGGGTPTTYPPEALAALIEHLRVRFGVRDGAEITIEANPDEAARPGLAALHAAGANRLSIGVQSFVPAELRALGRRHSPAEVDAFVESARDAGFDNLSLDLMFGVPHQTDASWRASLEHALSLAPEHISTYGLTIEEGTPYERWFAREPAAFADEDLAARLYEIAIDTLEAAGYEQYEISNFARPGRRSAHNATYWRNDPYLGLGVGAASYLGGVRTVHTRDLETYVGAALADRPIPGDDERLEGEARAGEAAMLALRTREGVDADAFRERYGIDVLDRYRDVVARYAEAGLLAVEGRRVALTRRGRFVANDVCAAFLAD